jgi:hypothetical protein
MKNILIKENNHLGGNRQVEYSRLLPNDKAILYHAFGLVGVFAIAP